jgi:D-alanine-D-alanine ligase
MGSEYEVSLKTGATALAHIPRERYEVHDIFIDRSLAWHLHGCVRSPATILRQMDVVWNALHGEWGEDGGVQEVLDAHGARYTGSDAPASRRTMQKAFTKAALAAQGIKTPVWRVLYRADGNEVALAAELYRSFPQSSIVKPLSAGSSVGVSIARSARELANALARAFAVSETALIEEYIAGKEATVGVVQDFRGQEAYPLLPIEIVPAAGALFFDYGAKYGGASEEICPGKFTKEESEELQKTAAMAHTLLGLRHYSRSDFIVHPRRGIYFLEINSLPGLTNESLLPKALRAVGTDLPDFFSHVLELALSGH